ncbi:glyoxylase [Aspergillus avenaceus]|uniref:hydroxyacylglutathione hydrolase n=1 Tax=Aspergillus avenaceus TaxID=36643 RepID=A0A5N6THC0_ASPAV|nr:glyoxylase [Aspergillus avenaceus]
MAKVVFTPWKGQSQLLAVRSQFYPPPEYNGPDMRSRACATVAAWKLRGNLPHPVEATALLTDAILHDDAQKNSIFSIRATYSAAFCRFVTGLVDSKLHGQRKTMFQRAIDLGLPASFVELRHEATHRELPSLTVLRDAAQRSLEWLWDYYWAKVDLTPALPAPVPDAADDVDHDLESVKFAVRASLEQIANESGASEPPRKKQKFRQVSGVATQLISVCKGLDRGSAAVSGVLLEESGLIPAGRGLGDSLAEQFAGWDRLLQQVTEGHPAFLAALTEAMVDTLAFAVSATKDNARCEGVYMWLDHILRSTPWESQRRLLSVSYMRSACVLKSNHWTNLLKESIEDAAKEVSRVPESQDGQKAEMAPPDLRTGTLDDQDGLKNFGWEVNDTWDSRPLGIWKCFDSPQCLRSSIINSDSFPMSFTRAIRPSLGLKSRIFPRSVLSPAQHIRNMQIQSIPMWTGKGNNYAYLVTDEPTKQSVIIDPANPPEVAPVLESQIKDGNIDLTAIVNTHHHWDHAGGNNEMLKIFGKLSVIGGKECQSVTKTPAHGETFKIGERISVKALHTPCHTQDSICYFMQDGDEKAVFTGDTLFIGGCGRFFEGTAPEMHKALNETLASLPDDTKVFPGHEYTKGNVKFCLAVSQSEPIKKLEAFAEQNQQTQGKFTIGDEKTKLILQDLEIQQKTGKTNPVEVMAALREMKNAM